MKGSNEIHINQATMIEAMQEYFNKRYNPNFKILNVKGTVINGYSETFEIKIEELKETE